MKKVILAVLIIVAMAAAVYAVDINGTLTHTWTPQAGDAIRSVNVRTDHAEEEAYANTSADSTVDWNNMSANSVNASHLAPGAVHAVHIDSGAIMFDTQIAFNAISALKIVSTTDTASNFTKSMSGFYIGDGTDSRNISSNYITATETGTLIPFTITKVVVHVNGGNSVNGYDFADDTFVMTQNYGGGAINLQDVGGTHQGLWGGWINGTGASAPYFVNTSDTHYFIVNDEGGGTLNTAGTYYVWSAEGY